MNKPTRDYNRAPRLVALAANRPVAVAARRGTEVRSLKGELWIAQEGDRQDYFVPEGARFHTARSGRFVVRALDAPARMLVSASDRPPAAEPGASRVTLDYRQLEAVRIRAEQRRARELVRLFRGGLEALKRAWCRVMTPAAPGCGEAVLR